jgi:hypothetical protein
MRRRCLLAALFLFTIPAWAQSPLKSVQKIFIEKLGNDFDQDLRVQVTRQFKGQVNVVLDRAIADAILVGTSNTKDASGGQATLRYLGLDNVQAGTLTLLDKTGKIILWSDEAGDRAPWLTGGPTPSSRKVLAERLIRKLKRAIDTAK